MRKNKLVFEFSLLTVARLTSTGLTTLFGCIKPATLGVMVFWAFAMITPCVCAADTAWKAGLARAKVTPQKPVYLAGYASRSRPFDSVLADLHVKSLALEDSEGHRAVLVTSDVIGFSAEVAALICDGIEKTVGLERSQILLAPSHTHTGPMLSLDPEPSARDMTAAQAQDTVDYTRWLIDQVIAVSAKAFSKMQPVELSHGKGVASFVMNRREFTERGVRLGVNPSGLADRSVPVLRVDSADGKLLAVVFGTACHNTTLTGHHYIVSGDYAGFAQSHVEAQFPGAMAMFLQGCGGSANPYPRGTVEAAQAHGTELGTEVCRLLKTDLAKVSGPLHTEFATVTLPLQAAPPREEIERLATERGGWRTWVAHKMLDVLQKGESLPDSYRAPFAVWQFGDSLTLVGLSGEVVVEYVPLLEESLGPLNLWIAAYCNDVYGYLPSVQVLREGGYETRGLYSGGIGFFSLDVQDVVIAQVRALAVKAGRPGLR